MSKYRLPKPKCNRCIVAFGLLVAILSLTACLPRDCPSPNCPPDDERERVVLIFSDVTSSLLESESKQVGTLTCDIVDSLPPGTRYYVYPIQIEAQKLESIDEGTIVFEKVPETERIFKTARRNKISQKIKTLYELIKSIKRRPDNYGKPDNQTCILYTLEFAQDKFKHFDQKKTDFELIYVSDMIEQCNTTPMGKPISLEKTNISESIKLAQETNLGLDLSYASVSMIIPANNDTYVTSGRPNVSDLRSFWKGILSHCGFSKELLESDKKFYFSSGLPPRFEATKVTAR